MHCSRNCKDSENMLKNLRENRGEGNPYIYRHIYRNSEYENDSERKGAGETAGEAHPDGISRSAEMPHTFLLFFIYFMILYHQLTIIDNLNI